jgi:hypothetical protein
MDGSPTTPTSQSLNIGQRISKGIPPDRLNSEVRSLAYSLADLLLKFIAFKGKTDAICAQKLREKVASQPTNMSRVSVRTLSDSSTSEATPSDNHVQKVLTHCEEICDKLFDIFDIFFEEFHSLIDGSSEADWSVKGRDKSLRVAQEVVEFMRRKDDRRFKVLSLLFVLLLGCLMATIMWSRFGGPQVTLGTQTEQ